MSSSLPRLELGDLPPTLVATLEPRVRRLGYLGEFFKCTAHHPEGLAAFIEFTEASQSGLSKRLVELIALTCSAWMGNDYERNQHEHLAVRLGFERDWIAAINALTPDASSAMTDEERSIQRLTLTVLDTGGKGAADSFAKAVQSLGPRIAIAILMVIGRYAVHGLITNTLGLNAPVPSIFEDGFEG